jgi:hypothetical protein
MSSNPIQVTSDVYNAIERGENVYVVYPNGQQVPVNNIIIEAGKKRKRPFPDPNNTMNSCKKTRYN